MNQWPVVFLSLKNIDGLTFSTAYQQLAYEIGLLFEKHKYLLTDEKIGPAEKELFERLKNRSASEVEVSRSLQFLLQLMTQHYGKAQFFFWTNTMYRLPRLAAMDIIKKCSSSFVP